jgi:hypothetical protein
VLTLVLQTLSAFGLLVFGLLTVGAYRRVRPSDPHRPGWYAAAVVFGLYGVSALVTAPWAVVAFRAGPGTAAWDSFLRVAPAANFGRIFLVYAMICALFLLAAGAGERIVRPAVPIAAGVALVGGVWMAGATPPAGSGHAARLAALQSVEVVGIFVALLVALRAEVLDGTLWLALATLGFSWALDTPLLAVLATEARIGVPAPWVAMAVRTLFTATALVLIAHRWSELRAGAVPRPLLLTSRAPTF